MTGKEKEAYYKGLNDGIDIMTTELTKYKRVFHILKDNINMELICSNHDFLCKPMYALDVYANKQIELTKEEYELLEELMKDENC